MPSAADKRMGAEGGGGDGETRGQGDKETRGRGDGGILRAGALRMTPRGEARGVSYTSGSVRNSGKVS